MTSERRRSPRRRTFKGAQIILNNRGSTIDCNVRNLSSHGALLVLPSLAGIPAEFELRLDGELRPARIVWKGIGKIGIAWS
jgi:PilZ domain